MQGPGVMSFHSCTCSFCFVAVLTFQDWRFSEICTESCQIARNVCRTWHYEFTLSHALRACVNAWHAMVIFQNFKAIKSAIQALGTLIRLFYVRIVFTVYGLLVCENKVFYMAQESLSLWIEIFKIILESK